MASRQSAPTVPKREQSFTKLLEDAVNKPGVLSQAYYHFHSYSLLNRLLAWFECHRRNIEPGPIHTFKGWLSLNRHVRKGEKGITLCMPVMIKDKQKDESSTTQNEDVITRQCFIYRANWFVLSQTDGEELTIDPIPNWDESLALEALDIDRVPFDLMDGNVQGFARGREMSVSPIAYLPQRTLIHEMAHVLLGHTAENTSMIDQSERTPRDIREVEAESVAYIVTQSLGLPGEEFSRGYLQHWLNGQSIAERSAQHIFRTADAILKAGRPVVTVESSDSINPSA